MEPPHAPIYPPLGDGAYEEEMDRVIWKCVIFLVGNTSLSHFEDAQQRRHACMPQRASEFSE
jgi:hypothetical protein